METKTFTVGFKELHLTFGTTTIGDVEVYQCAVILLLVLLRKKKSVKKTTKEDLSKEDIISNQVKEHHSFIAEMKLEDHESFKYFHIIIPQRI